MGFGKEGGRACMGEKNPTIPKKSGLQKKQSARGRPPLSWASRSVSRAPLQEGEASCRGEQGAMLVLPQHGLHVPLQPGEQEHGGSRAQAWTGLCSDPASAGPRQAAPVVGFATTRAH